MNQALPAFVIPTGPLDQSADSYVPPAEQISQIDEDPDF